MTEEATETGYLGTIPAEFPGEELEHVYQRHSKCLLCHLEIFLQQCIVCNFCNICVLPTDA